MADNSSSAVFLRNSIIFSTAAMESIFGLYNAVLKVGYVCLLEKTPLEKRELDTRR